MRLSPSLTLLALVAPVATLALLSQKFESKGKLYFGAALDVNTLRDEKVRALAQTEYGQITPENSMKWEVVQPQRGVFNFDFPDQIVDFAVENGRLLRGHTLVWHSQLAPFVEQITDAADLISLIQTHISTVAGRYAGKIYAWDVVNEVFNEDGSFRDSVFFRLLGEEFIDLAFAEAKKADPNAKLYLNDFNLDFPGPKIDAFIALVGRLKERGVPIEGLGTQSHLILGQVDGVPTQLERLGALGLELAITELDIRVPELTEFPAGQQAKDYITMVDACLKIEACVGVTVWGVSDRDSWVDATFPGFDEPLLFDDDCNEKEAYTALNGLLS